MSYVRIERPRPHVAVVRMDRPERMNSMAFELVVPLHEALAELAADNDTRCVILTGTGRGFCSGADTQGTAPPPNIDGLTLTRIATRSMTLLADLVLAMRRMPQPVICAVNGAAIGGGLCLALGGDIRLAAESAYFRAAGINNGLTATELGLSFLLAARRRHLARLRDRALRSRRLGRRRRSASGWSRACVPDAQLLDAALDLAEQINGWSAQGVQLTKRMLWAGLETGSLQAAIELESHTQLFVRLTTQNFEEATLARREGRKPVFRD